MTNGVCPACGAEYEEWTPRCAQCEAPLPAPRDAVNPLDLPDEERVVYEMGVWPLDLQASAAEALAESGVPHAWDGTDLVVPLVHEAHVDALLDSIEAEAGLTEAADEEGGAAVNDPDAELVYDLDDWDAEARDRLAGLLDEGGIPYRWEDGDEAEGAALVVAGRDEAVVEQLMDRIEYPDALVADGDAEAPVEHGEAPYELLSQLYLAADRLKGNPLDPDGIADLGDAVDEADPLAPPYGIAPTLWARALELADEVADALGADEEEHTEDAAAKAAELRELLRPYV
jgi:hypothetical protein